MTRPAWSLRLHAALSFADHLLCHLDSLISAHLDIRPVRSQLADFAAWWGSTWRTHLHAAQVRRYGPGRGLLILITNRTETTTEKEAPHER